MGNSKHRKNHKQKLANRKQQIQEAHNKVKKADKERQEFYRYHMLLAQQEHVISTIMKGRPEMAKKINTKDTEGNDTYQLVVDTDNMEEREGVLYFKATDNPLMAGLAQLEDYTTYNTEYVNAILERIAYKQKMSQQFVTKEADISELVGPVDEPIELVEDDSFISDAIIIEETKSE